MIQFKKITEENFVKILCMEQAEGQHFVPPNAESLAQAWLYYENHDVYSFAIYHDEAPVGFMQLEEEMENRCMYLWRIMIDAAYQGQGYGTAAVEKIIDLVRESGKYAYMELGCKPDNMRGMHIYEKLGFRLAGPEENGELPMRLNF